MIRSPLCRPFRVHSTQPAWLHFWMLALLAAVLCGARVSAQDAGIPILSTEATPEGVAAAVDTGLAGLDAVPDLTEESRKQIREQYELAKRYLASAQEYRAKREAYAQLRETGPERLEEMRSELKRAEARKGSPVAPKELDAADVAVIESGLTARQADLASIRARQEEIRQTKALAAKRPLLIKEQLAEARRKVDELIKQMEGMLPQDTSVAAQKAQSVLANAQLLEQKEIARTLEQEIAVQDLQGQLLNAESALLAVRLDVVSAEAEALQQGLSERRRKEAEALQRDAEQALEEAAGRHPAILALTRQNAEWGRLLTEAVKGRSQTLTRRDAVRRQIQQIDDDFQASKRRLQVAGLSDALGQVLRDQRLKLPSRRSYRKVIRQRQGVIGEIALEKIRVEDRLTEVRQTDSELQRLLSMGPGTAEDPTPKLRDLLEVETGLLNELNDALTDYVRDLVELDYEEQQLLDRAEEYAAYLDEHLLWIRSARPVGIHSLQNLGLAASWFLAPGNWIDTLSLLGKELVSAPAPTVLTALLAGVLWRRRGDLRSRETKSIRYARKISTDSFWHTVSASGLVLIQALPLPLIFAYTGWQLATAPDAEEFPRAVGSGMLACAVPLFVLLAVRYLFRAEGVCEAHFKWNPRLLDLVRRQVSWILALLLPLMFVMAMTSFQVEISRQNSLGRLAFVLSMVGLGVLLYRLLWSTQGGVVSLVMQRDPEGGIARLRLLWGGAILSVPVVLIGLSLLGYHYSALQLLDAVRYSLRLLLGLLLLKAVVLRWFLVGKRKLDLAQALERRQAARQAAGASGEVTPQGTELMSPEALERSTLDLTKLSEQTRSLINTLMGWTLVLGLWWIWADVLPALKVLDTVELWHYTVTVDGQPETQAATLQDLALIVVAGALLFAAARNLPAMLEVIFLQRLPITTGSRYAITTLVQYGIVGAGVFYILQILGLSWSQIQWLVAALGVGLGFGLQEIFANFISGLIILFERPIRVGDTITVGDVTGNVSRIRIRATTIRDWDRKELIVPNKAFITEEVINWTLSDPMTRLVIRIGVAYGTDTDKARDLVMEVVRQNPLVLEDPKPTMYFEQFGDSSLNLVLRVYVQELDHRLPVTHELHTAINAQFQRHGIVIPFPQRDIHVYSESP